MCAEGRGLGGKLIRAALDASREQRLDVRPYCPFVHEWIGKHPEYTARLWCPSISRVGSDC
ncbi:GNAT family N-acetyltransferase [Streptomyces xantholiticus]|uniref:GNAT family N-acetyltransferase n=1 Tax=Streptomyces xantholiticus TaxID=68285 RepID=A0ABV1V4M5_9ACTN